MRKRKFPLVLALGASLVLISFIWMIAFQIRMYAGARQSHRIVSEIDEILPERTQGVSGIYPGTAMPAWEIQGTDYVAILEIPSFGLTLPVADKWEDSELSCSPARFLGSAYDSTLIIGGYDDARQFGFCDQMELWSLVTVTDMTGAQFTYSVSKVDRSSQAQTQWLMDADCDLTLFCRDLYTMEYIAVRCNLA